MRRPRITVRRVMVAVAVGALICGVIGIWVAWLRAGVNVANYERIRLGMGGDEVVTLIGRQPDSSVLMLGRIAGPELFAFDGQTGWFRYQEWDGARITIVTISDPDSGRVLCRYSVPGPLDRLRQWRPW
ncbi:MAG: hypothetical protein JWN86_2229 [Planctomycetota bacterium]|nr:hypothetical protein [Planctomycetota bacterium]